MLFINQKKSELFLKEIKYLGHFISQLGICMDLENLEVKKGWLIPTNIHKLRRLIGMCAYYRRFIEKFPFNSWPIA